MPGRGRKGSKRKSRGSTSKEVEEKAQPTDEIIEDDHSSKDHEKDSDHSTSNPSISKKSDSSHENSHTPTPDHKPSKESEKGNQPQNQDQLIIDTARKILMNSLKRTFDMYASNSELPLPLDLPSQKLKLSIKINDDYFLVKNLPPPTTFLPPPTTAPSTAPSTVSASPTPSASTPIPPSITALPTHPYPGAPGVKVGDEKPTEPSVSALNKLFETLPPSFQEQEQNKQSSGVADYRRAAGHSSHFEPPPAGAHMVPPLTALVRTGPAGGSPAGGGPSTSLVRSSTQLSALFTPPPLPKATWHPPWKLMRVISGHTGWVRAITVDPSNDWFATGAADRAIKIWDLATGQLKLTLTGHINCVRGLVVSERHPYLFSCGEDKMVKCWDLEYNKAIRQYHGHLSGVYTISLHPTIDVLVTGGRDATARVWDVRTKAQVHVLSGHTNTVMDVKTQGSDPQVITGSADTTIKLWDLAAGACRTTLTNHKKSIRSMVVHPKEYSFCSGGADNLKKWKFPDGQFIENFSGHKSIVNTLALSSDNVLFSGGDDGSMCFWDWRSGYNFQSTQSIVQPGSLESEAGIYASSFDHSGSRLITCEADKTIKFWAEDEEATEETHPVDFKPSRIRKHW